MGMFIYRISLSLYPHFEIKYRFLLTIRTKEINFSLFNCLHGDVRIHIYRISGKFGAMENLALLADDTNIQN